MSRGASWYDIHRAAASAPLKGGSLSLFLGAGGLTVGVSPRRWEATHAWYSRSACSWLTVPNRWRRGIPVFGSTIRDVPTDILICGIPQPRGAFFGWLRGHCRSSLKMLELGGDGFRCKNCGTKVKRVVVRHTFGRLAQLVRALARQARGHWFEPSIAHSLKPFVATSYEGLYL
jgi:hypothetical protein